MRRVDWLLAAVIGAFLVAFLAAQGLSQAMVGAAGDVTTARQSFAQRLVSPRADPISVQSPTLLPPRQ